MHQVHFVQDSALLQCNGIPLSKFKQSPGLQPGQMTLRSSKPFTQIYKAKVALRWEEAAFLLFATSEDSLGFHLPVL